MLLYQALESDRNLFIRANCMGHANAFIRACFSEALELENTQRFGDPKRFMIYRQMVRSRIRRMVETALPRTFLALGDRVTQGWYAGWLESTPPTTPYFRELPVQFADHVFAQGNPFEGLACWTEDLMRYELLRWRTSYIPHEASSSVVPFDFDKRVVLNPSASLYQSTFDVPQLMRMEAPLVAGKAYLVADHLVERTHVSRCVFRDPQSHRVRSMALNPLAQALLEGWESDENTAKEVVDKVIEQRNITKNGEFITGLGTLLAQLVEAGVVLGSR